MAAIAKSGDALQHASDQLKQDDPDIKLLAQVPDSGLRRQACEVLQQNLSAGFEGTLPLLCHPDDGMQAVGASVAAACFAPAESLADPEPELDLATEANPQPELPTGGLPEAADTEPKPKTSAEAAMDAEADADEEAPELSAEDWWEGDGEWELDLSLIHI